jgi:hypothetical protein
MRSKVGLDKSMRPYLKNLLKKSGECPLILPLTIKKVGKFKWDDVSVPFGTIPSGKWALRQTCTVPREQYATHTQCQEILVFFLPNTPVFIM